MGKLIDVDEVKKRYPIMENDFGMVVNERLHKELDEIPPAEAIPKADYEAKLKNDMVVMLEEFDLILSQYEDSDLIRVDYLRENIQDKIYALEMERVRKNEN